MNTNIFPAKRRSFLVLIAALVFFPLASRSQVLLRCNLENKTVQIFHVKIDTDKPTVFEEKEDGQFIQQGKPIVTADKIIFVSSKFLEELRRWISNAQLHQSEYPDNDSAMVTLREWKSKIDKSEPFNTLSIDRTNLSLKNGEGSALGRCQRIQTKKTVF